MNEYQWLIVIVGIVAFTTIVSVYYRYIQKTIKLQNQFFNNQVKKRSGQLNKTVPFGFTFTHQNLSVKVYILKVFVLEVNCAHNNDASLLMVNKYPSVKIPHWLMYSPGKKGIFLNPSFDQRYFTQGKDETWIRNVFSESVQESMLKSIIGRISIKNSKLTVQFRVITLKDILKIDQSIDTCLMILDNILKSSAQTS